MSVLRSAQAHKERVEKNKIEAGDASKLHQRDQELFTEMIDVPLIWRKKKHELAKSKETFVDNRAPTLDEIKKTIHTILNTQFLMTCNAMAKTKKKKKIAKPKVGAIPKDHHSVTPVLTVKGADQAIEFYKKAFGAKELHRAYMPGGNLIMNAEVQIGDSQIMLNDEFPEMNSRSPQSVGGASTALYVYVRDVEKIFAQAEAAGAIVTMPVMDAFWGDRTGQLIDPYGHIWSFATRKRNLTRKEMQKAQEKWFAEMAKGQQQAVQKPSQ